MDMPDSDRPPLSHPLQLGQVLYPVYDTTLIAVPKGSRTACFRRVSFSGSQAQPEPIVHDPIEVGPIQAIRSARAVTHWAGGRQEIALLADRAVLYIAMKDGKERLDRIPVDHDVAFVIGLDPDWPEERRLALITVDQSGYSLLRMGIATDGPSTAAAPLLRLPPSIKGKMLAVELARRGASATLMLVMRAPDASLQIHALAWKDLAAAATANDAAVATVTLGPASSDATAVPNVVVARMWSPSSDQQLALTWVDAGGTPQISLIGWGVDRKLVVLSTIRPDLSSAVPERPVYRVVAADLLGRGVDQLIVGYPATHAQPKKVEGCASLMLFELDDTPGAGPTLVQRSQYTVADAGDQPLTSYDLHLGAGLFGRCLGIQVIGSGARLSELLDGEASVRCGFIPVDPDNGGMPPMPSDGRVAPLCTVASSAAGLLAHINPETQILAFPSDMEGRSLILGAPNYERKAQCGQILAIVQAPPFDRRTVSAGGEPNISISWASGSSGGCSVSSDNSYTTTSDLSIHMALGSLFNLSSALHHSYGESFSKVDDASTSSNIQFHALFKDDDYLLQYEMGYDVWRYPVLSTSDQMAEKEDSAAPPAEVIVVIAHDATPRQMWRPARNFAYRPRSEIGMLLSYVGLEPEHYSDGNLLFELQGSTVETGTVSMTYDQSKMTNTSRSKHLSVVNSLAGHVGMSAGTELFEELPITFGINAGMSKTDANSEVNTTHLTNHSAMSLTVSFGQVKDKEQEFAFTPRIYQHGKLGCLMVTWDVEMPTGGAWTPGAIDEDPTLTSAQVCMIRIEPDTGNPVVRAFSRSFYFKKSQGDLVDVSAEIFNNGRLPAEDVSCEFYEGQPELSYDKQKKRQVIKLPAKQLGIVKLDGLLGGAKRTLVTLPAQSLAADASVTVRLFVGDLTNDDCIFWGRQKPNRVA